MSDAENHSISNNSKKRDREWKPFDSKYTDEDRREIRKKLRGLVTEIDDRKTDILNTKSNAFQQMLNKGDDLNKYVCTPREGVIDAEGLFKMANLGAQQAKKIATAKDLIDHRELIKALQTKFGETSSSENNIDFKSLGAAVGCYFKTIPRFEFMLGPIRRDPNVIKKARKKIIRAASSNEAKTSLLALDDEEATAGITKKLTDRRVNTMKHKIKKIKKEKEDEEGEDAEVKQCLVDLLFNKKSFTQTVENIFDFSFLVKAGEQSLELDKHEEAPVSGWPATITEDAQGNPDISSDKQKKNNQVIWSFSMKDWNKINKEINPKGLIPHRK